LPIADCQLPIADCRLPIANYDAEGLSIGNRQLAIGN
jgi:hypothetical protein